MEVEVVNTVVVATGEGTGIAYKPGDRCLWPDADEARRLIKTRPDLIKAVDKTRRDS